MALVTILFDTPDQAVGFHAGLAYAGFPYQDIKELTPEKGRVLVEDPDFDHPTRIDFRTGKGDSYSDPSRMS